MIDSTFNAASEGVSSFDSGVDNDDAPPLAYNNDDSINDDHEPSLKRPSINPPAEKRQHVTINAPRNPYITDNTNVPINPYVSVPPNCCYPHFLPLLHRYKLQCTTYLELIPMNVRTKMPSLPTFPPCEDDDYEDYNDADKDAVDAMPF